ncbi:SPOR domain-containing protein [Edaphobacter paludis]|uniref:SPOR domain-containing protein n=1 Tax=Edaphobacter paludis TaxID=3035702 RepID=A0AAU7DDJ1_9BACT
MYSRNRDMEEDDEPVARDREMTLGTSFIVGIFFALVLICAIFFAFGYSLGRRSALPASGVAAPAPAASTDTDGSASKPASGIPESQASSTNSSADDNSADSSDEQQPPPEAKHASVAPPAKAAVRPTPVSRTTAPSATNAGAGETVVQVAAVSRQGDADMLMSALKRHGYNAAVHQSPQDKLLHVQIGPFATKKDAEVMRQRLIGDGYNAIVK